MWGSGKANERMFREAPSLQDLLIRGRAASALRKIRRGRSHPIGKNWQRGLSEVSLGLGAIDPPVFGACGFAPEIHCPSGAGLHVARKAPCLGASSG